MRILARGGRRFSPRQIQGFGDECLLQQRFGHVFVKAVALQIWNEHHQLIRRERSRERQSPHPARSSSLAGAVAGSCSTRLSPQPCSQKARGAPSLGRADEDAEAGPVGRKLQHIVAKQIGDVDIARAVEGDPVGGAKG